MRRARKEAAAAAVVLDTGAAHVHIACSEHPDMHTVPNAIARTRQGVRRQVLVGDLIESECQDYGGLQLRQPMDRGMIVDWAAQKSVWDRALIKALGCKTTTDTFGLLRGRTVIVTEPYFALPEQQRAFDMLLFEWYEADAIWRTTTAQLIPWSLTTPRPEALLVVDMGHSYTHAVPIIRDQVVWDAVRRLDLGGKVLTSLLKVLFSYRQWNMMDETYLTDKMKCSSCFVAACARDEERRRFPPQDASPSSWSFEQLVEMFHADENNAMVQQYVLPNYATPEDVADPRTKYGHVLSGPAAYDTPTLPEDELDAFIAGSTTPSQHVASTEHQVLRLGQERFQLFESFFAPKRIGLDQGSLPELIATCISHVQEEARDMLWTQIVLVGGSARVPGLRRRLSQELRMWAPDDVPVQVHVPHDPIEASLHGARTLWQASPTSEAGRCLASHLVQRSAWLDAGGSHAPPGERGGTTLGDTHFGGWNTT